MNREELHRLLSTWKMRPGPSELEDLAHVWDRIAPHRYPFPEEGVREVTLRSTLREVSAWATQDPQRVYVQALRCLVDLEGEEGGPLRLEMLKGRMDAWIAVLLILKYDFQWTTA